MEIVIKPLTRRAAQPHLNSEQVQSLRIILPPLDLQTKFANIVTKIEEQKALVKQAIAESEHLFNSLMSEYFD
jgi:type I restriction enzyme S subunit